MTPTLGRGANAAMRDGVRLAQQLTAVAAGRRSLAGALAACEAEMTAYGFDVVRNGPGAAAGLAGLVPGSLAPVTQIHIKGFIRRHGRRQGAARPSRPAASKAWTIGHGWGAEPRQSRGMCLIFLAGVVGGSLAHVLVGECCVKLKDYEIPQYGLGDGSDQEDLKQYSLKNFDLKAFQLAQQQPDPAPILAPCEPSLPTQETDSPGPLAAAPEEPSAHQPHQSQWSSTLEQPNEPSFSHAPSPVETELNQPALDPSEVQFGAHFSLQTVSYTPLSPPQQWKVPRWVITMVGLFFGSAAVLMIAFCVVLLRDPKAAPTGQPEVPTAVVATTPAAPTQPASTSPMNKAPGDVVRAPSARAPEATTKRDPAARTANLMHDDAMLGHRSVVSRHPSVVRRQVYGARRVASTGASSSVEAQETETASRRPAPDALDKLLGESSL
jgi:hypothetical protein